MKKTHNPTLVENSQRLRKSMTAEEKHLWYDFLKSLPVNVNRQKIIGSYIVDFYIPSSKIVIELDGSQHYEENARKADQKRDNFLESLGITVLRYTNLEINTRFKNVCFDIWKRLNPEGKSD